MGFGLLLAGYFTLTFLSFAVGNYAFAFYAVGGAVSFIAAGKLYEYKHRFGITVATSLGWIALGVYGAVAFLGDVFLWELPLPGMDATVPNLVLFLLQLVHTAGLLSATDCLARQVGAEKVKSAIPWDAGILGTWAVGQVILLLFHGGHAAVVNLVDVLQNHFCHNKEPFSLRSATPEQPLTTCGEFRLARAGPSPGTSGPVISWQYRTGDGRFQAASGFFRIKKRRVARTRRSPAAERIRTPLPLRRRIPRRTPRRGPRRQRLHRRIRRARRYRPPLRRNPRRARHR